MGGSNAFVVADDGTAFNLNKIVAVYSMSTSALKVALEGSFSVMVARGSYAEYAIREYIAGNTYTPASQPEQQQ